jgi:Na+/H+ antiporter NhaD/arsenite permease-like protein
VGLNELGISLFAICYLGIALGGIPGLALDRTGVALLGAAAMLVANVLSLDQAVAVVDYGTLILLFGLMLLSAQFRLGGFYSHLAERSAKSSATPRQFLAWVIALSALLSAVLSNDVVCLVLTPLVVEITLQRRWNPMPFVLALPAASNIGSAATLIGNPQNMFIGQRAALDFGEFLWWCGPPSVLSLGLLFAWCSWRGQLTEPDPATDPVRPPAPMPAFAHARYDRYQTGKALFLAAALIVLFFTDVPRELSVLGATGVLMLSKRLTTSQFLSLVDWSLLVLFIALFVLLDGFRLSGGMLALNDGLSAVGVSLADPAILGTTSVVMSNLVSNVPAVMLLMADWRPGQEQLAYLLALTSTYAGNLLLIGSIANLIVASGARPYGVVITFKRHFLWTAPIALASQAVGVGWWALLHALS